MNTQVKVALHKQAHPEKYCPVHACLWRTNGGYCPRHKPFDATMPAPWPAPQPRGEHDESNR